MTPAPSHFPPIADYAFLSNCEVNALVAPSGNVEWLCLPRPDSPSVFAAVLDRSAGAFRLGPSGVTVPSQRRYLPGTNVLETVWQTNSGWLVVHDALVMKPWVAGTERRPHYRRAPADFVAESMLLRTVTCTDGSVEVLLDCIPAFDYRRESAPWEYASSGYGIATCTPPSEEPALRLTTDLRLDLIGARASARTTLSEGQTAFVALSWNDAEPPSNATEAFDLMQSTARFWRRWLRDAELPDHRFKPYLERSALTLKGLTYAPTGAMLAAATTSLPETPGGERNWDYRYTWVRDSTFILWALRALGLHLDAEEFFAFLLETVGPQGFELQIMYGIGGERELTESTLDHLTGYEGARPVRIGNGAYDQRQHDVWGTILDAVLMHGRHIESAPDIVWQGLRKVVEAALEHWREPDRGIWEVRGEPKHFTSSKVMCWVAADRGARLAERRGDPIAEEWRAAADEIHAEVCERGVDKRGVFTQHYDTDALDAAALLMPLYGFLPGSDPRIRHTVLAIADELTENGLVLRYRVDATDDGLSGEEGTFTICSFWLVSALSEIGEAERARALCERLLSHASPLGLYAEEIEASSGRHLGNFPQAFTHLALINAVLHVVHDEQENGAP